MKILIVINNLYLEGNGLNMAVRRTVKALRETGHEVRVMSCPSKGANLDYPKPDYPTKEQYWFVFQPIIDANGFCYAQIDRKLIREALEWADVAHIEEFFPVNHAVMNMAVKMGKPVTATYHLHPENITYNLNITHWHLPNKIFLKYWTRVFMNKLTYIQCPTESVQDRLYRYHVKAKTEVISNGLIPDKCIRPEEQPEDYLNPERPLKLIYIGRFSNDKDHMTLLEAMRYTKYNQRIQLQFAGSGPKKKKFQRYCDRLMKEGVLKYKPTFGYYDRDGLRHLAAEADLAVHCAPIEVEGLSIMEAMQQGVVPVIAVGRRTGTSQFALDRRSKFPQKNPEALAKRIDYWFDHPEERWQMGKRYAESMQKYDINESARQLVDMFQKAIDENNLKHQLGK